MAQSSIVGQQFSIPVTVSSVGPDNANGTIVTVERTGATNIAIPALPDCVASGGAACPTNWAVTGSKLTGTIPALPVNGSINFSYQGKDQETQVSIITTVTATLPTGITDPILDTNTTTKGTQLGLGQFQVTKKVAKASAPGTYLEDVNGSPPVVAVTDVLIWEITVKNLSSVPATEISIYEGLLPPGSSVAISDPECVIRDSSGVQIGGPCALSWNLGTHPYTRVYPFGYGTQGGLEILPQATLTIKYRTTLVGPILCENIGYRILESDLDDVSAKYFARNNYRKIRVRVPAEPCPILLLPKLELNRQVALVASGQQLVSNGPATPLGAPGELAWTYSIRNTSSTQTATNVEFVNKFTPPATAQPSGANPTPVAARMAVTGGTCEFKNAAGVVLSTVCPFPWPTAPLSRENPYLFATLNYFGFSNFSDPLNLPPGVTFTVSYRTTLTGDLECGEIDRVYPENILIYSAQGFERQLNVSYNHNSPYYIRPVCTHPKLTKTVAKASNPNVPLAELSVADVADNEIFIWTVKFENSTPNPITGMRIVDFMNTIVEPTLPFVPSEPTCAIRDANGNQIGEPCVLPWETSPAATVPRVILPRNLQASMDENGNPVITGDDSPLPTIPPGNALIVSYKTAFPPFSTTCAKGERVSNSVAIGPNPLGLGYFTGTPSDGYSVAATLELNPYDFVANVTGPTTPVSAGSEVSYELTASQACSGTSLVPPANISWQLPPPQNFIFDFAASGSMECTQVPAGRTCPTFSYDPATRKISAVFTDLPNSAFKIRVKGKAGMVQGMTAPTVATFSPTHNDAVLANNTTNASFEIQNAQTANRIEYQIKAFNRSGVELANLPMNLPVSGNWKCDTQFAPTGSVSWNLSIPKNTATATSPMIAADKLIWNQDRCAIVPDEIPAPTGWHWRTAPHITSTDQGGWQIQTSSRTVRIEGELEQGPPEIFISKIGLNCDVGQPTCPLTGAEFAIYNTDPATAGATPMSGSVFLGAGGSSVLRNLAPGNYWLVESKAPTGYTLLARAIPFTYHADETVTLGGTEGLVTVTPGDPPAGVGPTLVVSDTTPMVLPKAGGPGIWSLALAGTLLLAAGLTLHRITKRRN